MDLTKQKSKNFITVGKVLNSYGLNGQIKVDVYLEHLKLLQTVEYFFLGDSLLKIKINFLKNSKKSIWLAAISHIRDKEQAEKLRGQVIFLEKKHLPLPMIDEFYYEDLKGLQVKIYGGIQKGTINQVCNFGSGEVLEVSLDDRESTIYIPFNKENVGEIDLAKRTIILTPIKGLLT